jgi:hypothetical protein
VKTIGDIREASDAKLLSFQDLGAGSVAHLRSTRSATETPCQADRQMIRKPRQSRWSFKEDK